MKNEDRIVELLAESLIKQDRQADLLGRVVKTLETMGNTIGTMAGSLTKHSGRLLLQNWESLRNTKRE